MFRKSLSVLLSFVMLCCVFGVLPISVSAQETEIVENGANIEISADGTQSMSGNFSRNYTLTGNGANDIVAVAQAQNNRSQGSLGYTEGWCADFTSDCARLAGQESKVPFNGGVANLYNAIINAGGWSVSSPQKGDIAFFNYDHVGIMVDSVNCISGNMWDNSGSYVRTYSYTAINPGSVKRFLRPNYSSNPGPSFTSVDLGTDFYAIILNSHYWKPIENNNHNVVLGTENHTRKQLWKFERQNDLSYKIISLFDNEVIDLNNYGTANGTNIGMCASTDSSAQRWYITNNNGAYCFIPKCSPNGAMDINNNDSTDGTNIHYWAYHGKDSQTFSIYRIDDIAQYLSVDIGSNFTALILNSHYWKPIENRDHNVVLSTEDYSKKQLWRFERQSDKSYKIISLLDNEVIDLKDFGNANGTNIGMCVSTDSSAQRWYITNNNGAYCLIPKCSQDGAMDINNYDYADGTNIHYWSFHGKDSQTFSIYKIIDVNEYLNSHTDPTSVPTETTKFFGDVDDDGEVEIRDSTWIQRHVAEVEMPFVINKTTADVDGDGIITVMDATAIQYYLANMKTTYKIGEKIE